LTICTEGRVKDNSRIGVGKGSWSKDAVVSGAGICGNLKRPRLGVVGKCRRSGSTLFSCRILKLDFSSTFPAVFAFRRMIYGGRNEIECCCRTPKYTQMWESFSNTRSALKKQRGG
jgi:hypothetical protein